MVTIDHILQSIDRTLPVIFWLMWIDRASVKQFAGGIYNSDFAARAKARIDTHNNVMGKRWLAEERAQVVGKYLNGMVIRAFALFTTHIAFDGREQ